jgi:hypothetical protein
MANELDAEVAAFRTRPLDGAPYTYVGSVRRRSRPVEPLASLGAEPFGLTDRSSSTPLGRGAPAHTGWADRQEQFGSGQPNLSSGHVPERARPVGHSRTDRIRVIADSTFGPHRSDSDEILRWLPILGPTSSTLAFVFARHAARSESCWPTAYESVHRGELPALGFGRRLVVTRHTLETLVGLNQPPATNDRSNRPRQPRRTRWVRVADSRIEHGHTGWAGPSRRTSTDLRIRRFGLTLTPAERSSKS